MGVRVELSKSCFGTSIKVFQTYYESLYYIGDSGKPNGKTEKKKNTATTMAEKKEKSVQGAEGRLSQSNETDGAKQGHESEPSDVQQL